MAINLDDRALLRMIRPAGEAFFGSFDTLRPIQRAAIPEIFADRNVLITASTASGKTEAVMAPLVARLYNCPVSRSRIRILVVTPTRALVNDLYERLHTRLAQLGWTCGCQTSDRRNRDAEPHVLITTPESFDSTLIGGFRYDKANHPVDHLLAGVEGVFLDEGHCFASTLRGDQVLFLLERLRRLREWSEKKGLMRHSLVQICTASATVPNAEDVARYLLGDGAQVIKIAEPRKIEVLSSAHDWLDLANLADWKSLPQVLPVFINCEDIAHLFLQQRTLHKIRKVLVFVQSRAQCESLTAALRGLIKPVADIWIEPHHSSLSGQQREEAERGFAAEKDAILVSTSTMEVGVDIGDVDAVSLIGPPPAVSSLLQRIGRGNRKNRDLTRVIAFPRNLLESRVFAAQLKCAHDGQLRRVRMRRHWAVYAQQAFAFILQSHGEGRNPKDIVALAEQIWSDASTRSTAAAMLESFTINGTLREKKSKLVLGDKLAEMYERQKGDLYANFDTAAAGLAVYEQSTGVLLGHIAGIAPEAETITIGGRPYQIQDQDQGRMEVSPSGGKTRNYIGDSARYASRRMPRLEEFCGHLRMACGLQETGAPLVMSGRGAIWFHFGGEVWERLMMDLYPPHWFGRSLIQGVAKECFCNTDELRQARPDLVRLQQAIRRNWESLIQLVEHGRFFRFLSPTPQQMAAEELLDAPFWSDWINSREISVYMDKMDPRISSLLGLLT